MLKTELLDILTKKKQRKKKKEPTGTDRGVVFPLCVELAPYRKKQLRSVSQSAFKMTQLTNRKCHLLIVENG